MTHEEFNAAMAALGPFETAPHVAVAVSGGADSMALCLLADVWLRARGGRLTALTVNHRLRPESDAEAKRVGQWLAETEIEHKVLQWTDRKPSGGIQAAARAARYRILCEWCQHAGVFHLLLGHHEQDQVETTLMRLFRGSGIDGLSGMAMVIHTPATRLLRPLLNVSPARLKAVLNARGQNWIEDPSNGDPAFERTRVRAALPVVSSAGLTQASVIATTSQMAMARSALECAAHALLARSCHIHPAGYARVSDVMLAAAPREISLRVLKYLLAMIGGRAFWPNVGKVERLYSRIIEEKSPNAGTLSGCSVIRDRSGVLVCREERGLPVPVTVAPAKPIFWDGRFLINVLAASEHLVRLRLVALGSDGWREVVGAVPAIRQNPVPIQAAFSVPALADDRGIYAVPHLGYLRADVAKSGSSLGEVAFRPQITTFRPGYFLV